MRFFMISDLHLGRFDNNKIAEENIKLLCSKIRDEVSPYECLLFIILGDITEGGKPEGYEFAEKYLVFLKQELKDFEVQLEFIPGNHDLIDGNLKIFDKFIRKLGAEYSFMNSAVVSKEYDGVNFIFADSTLSRNYSEPGHLNLEAIHSQVKYEMQNILFCHHALTHQSEDEHNCVKDGKRISMEMRKTGIEFCFHSHTHTCDITLSKECLTEIGCGSISKNVDDMSGINNQLSVGCIRDGKIVGIERWIITNDGKHRFAYEELYPEERKFSDPEKIGKKKYDDVPKPHIARKIFRINKSSFASLSVKPLTLVDTLGESGRIFLLGNAGDGKTIELQKLACDLFGTAFFPFFYSLKDYTSNEICDIIPDEYHDLNPNRLVLILDGYDEIQEIHRHDFEGKLNVYLEKNPSVRVIVSARRNFCKISTNSESRTIRGFTVYEFEKISDEKIDEYLCELKIDLSSFRKAAELSRVYEMIYNPFYLDGLTKIFLDENNLPSKDLITEKIINQRFLNDDAKFSKNDLNEIKHEHFQCLENVAFAMQLMCKNQITDDEYQEIMPFEQRKLIKLSGLFSHLNVTWQFTHNIFCEYLAAKSLVKMPMEKILEYCCVDNKIKPSWANVFGYVVGLSDDNDLKKWVMNNACETLVKYNPDCIDVAEHFEIFKRVFDKYEQNYIRSYEGICTESELAYFACSVRGIDYLINKINFPENRFSLYNALRIMQYLPDTCGKQTEMRTCLLKFCKDYPKTQSYDCRCAIHVICKLNIYDSNITKRLMKQFGNCEDDYIRTGMYEYLVYTNEQNNYVHFFLDGIRFITYSLKSNGQRIGNESMELLHGLKAMSSIESISSVLEWFCNTEYPDFYDDDKVFCILASKCSKLYQGDNRKLLFNVMYNCWIWATKHYRHKEAYAVYNFFKETGSYEDAILRLISSEKRQGFFIGEILNCYPETKDILKQLYIEDKFPDRNSFAEFVKHYCSTTTYNRLAPPIDYEKERRNASLEYLSCLFDKNKYRTLIDDLLSEVGNYNITVEELREHMLNHGYYHPIERTKLAIERLLIPCQQAKDFLKIINWQEFTIDEIYTLIKNESLQLDDSQKKAVIKMELNECENGILNGVVSENGSLSHHVCIVTRFLVKLDITLSKTELSKLTAIPWFGFSSDNPKVKYTYLEGKYTKCDLIIQVVNDVQNSLVDYQTLGNHIDYLRKSQCKDIVDDARKICIQKGVDYKLGCSAIKYLHDLFGGDYIEHEVLPHCGRDMIMNIAKMFNDINRNKLKLAMEKEYCQKKDFDLQAYLISYNSKIALKDYLEEVVKLDSIPPIDGNIIGGTTEAISAVDDSELIPLLEELTNIAVAPSFKDREFNGLRSSLYNAFVNCARNNPDYVLKSVDCFLNSAKTEEELTYFHRLKNDVMKEVIQIKNIPLPIREVKNILSMSN